MLTITTYTSAVAAFVDNVLMNLEIGTELDLQRNLSITRESDNSFVIDDFSGEYTFDRGDTVKFLCGFMPDETGIYWDNVLKELDKAEVQEDYDGTRSQCVWIGSHIALFPSGKFYTFWTSNQTEWDVLRDSLYMEMLAAECNDHGVCYEEVDDDVFICRYVD